ncbi:DUF1501 domain-containing protein [Aquabacterium sp. OR-4]|uniref:DUF1501 domain-containing protein n=1 Tax=Aquabacterium sp. OR-4 TaxID=2978127 RepID=UPI0028C98AD2|nr:DUF1501 domain-containing protein [Aquabacterium sp. OR-4]MDT7838790.1 DUF1501 domain-containing protein [Aquabacterium sp. OR-4]
MPANPTLGRRAALHWLAAGLGATALPARLALAAGSDDALSPRLVVLMLRGALDGLAAVPAVGDPAWAALRGQAAAAPQPGTANEGSAAAASPAGAEPRLLPGTLFALHPALAQLHQWWGQGQLLILHAVASAYRERSHFDAQQLLESGGERPFALQTGWLGRALQASGRPAVALSPAMPVALRGAEQASTWTPSRRAPGSDDLLARVGQLYGDDRALADAWAKALQQQGLAREAGMAAGAGIAGMDAGQANGLAALARQAGAFLSAERGARVAWLEAGGWDTHTQQAGRLQRQLAALDDGLAALRSALGPHWARTSVLVMTEFGRTAVLNGSGGTDHGSGGVALLAGGAVAGGRVLTDWPGLAPAQLLDRRDLRPTQDIRAVIGALLQRQFGLSQAQLRAGILPGAPVFDDAQLWRA